MRLIFGPVFPMVILILDTVNSIETRQYQRASIIAAVSATVKISTRLYSVLTKWLNIAMKNKAILGFKIDIKNPSLAPFIRLLELLD